MKRILTAIGAVALLAAPGGAEEPGLAERLHAEALARVNTYANQSRTKAMVACIHWDGADSRIAFVTTSESEASGRFVPLQRLRMTAMRNCLGRAGAEGCDCASLDENGRNVLRVPGS